MTNQTAQTNQAIAAGLSNNLARQLKELSRDMESRILKHLHNFGHDKIRPSHSAVFSNLGFGAVRVTQLAERAGVTQQAMGKMLKELERLGYLARGIDGVDKRAREIRLTPMGVKLVEDSVRAIALVQQEYEHSIGAYTLQQLQQHVDAAVLALRLNYLPESWIPSSEDPQQH